MGGLLSSALGQAGQGVSNAATTLYQESGLPTLGQGVVSLFGGQPSEAGRLEALGTTVPEGVELLGPSETFTGPGFVGGLVQGLTGSPEPVGPDWSASSQTGMGLGEFLNFLNQIKKAGGGGGLAPMQPLPGGTEGSVEILPGYAPAAAPQGGLLHNLIKSYTLGLLNSQLGGLAGIGAR